MDEMELEIKWLDFYNSAHLYNQQYTIDEYKIDYDEFKRRLDDVNFIENVTFFDERLKLVENEFVNIIVQNTLQLYNNPPQ